jgi:predicted ester cyclase
VNLSVTSCRFVAAFPDLIREDEEIIAEVDRLWVRTTLHGTHLGQHRGIQPAGRQTGCRTVDILRATGEVNWWSTRMSQINWIS